MSNNKSSKKMREKGTSFIRVSSYKQKKGTSPKKQEQLCKQRAKELNVDLVNSLKIEDSITGTVFLKKYEKKIIQYITEENIKYFFVYSWDRFTRDLSVGADMLEKIVSLGGIIVTRSEIIDASSDRFLPHFQMVVSQYQRDTIVENGRKGQISRIKEGKYPFGHLPLGIKRDKDDRIYFDQSYKSLLEELYISVRNNKKVTYKSLASSVNKKYKKLLGKELSRDQIKGILKNPIYIGYVRLKKKRYGKNGSPTIPNPRLATIDENLFNKVQKIIEKNKKGWNKTDTPIADALSEPIETLGFDVVINNLDELIKIRCPKCESIKLVRMGPEIINGYFVLKYKCECGHQFRFPSTKQLKRLSSIDPRRCPKCGSANDFSVSRSALSDFYRVTCNKCEYKFLGSVNDAIFKQMFKQQDENG